MSQTSKRLYLFVVSMIFLYSSAPLYAQTYLDNSSSQNSAIKMTGQLIFTHFDFETPPPGFDSVMYFLVNKDTQVRLLFDKAVPPKLFGRKVTVTGQRKNPRLKSAQELPIIQVSGIDLEVPDLDPSNFVITDRNIVTGAYPIVFLLCKFPNISTIPHPVSWYQTFVGNIYPGLDDYWREQSYGKVTLAGSQVKGWYTLPHDKSYYDANGFLHFDGLINECAQVADADTYFPDFKGIVVITNDESGSSSGGSAPRQKNWDSATLYNYGVSAVYGPLHQMVTAHELGHAFGYRNGSAPGLAHSSGPYLGSNPYMSLYDSDWDVMSYADRMFSNSCPHQGVPFGCIAVGTIANNKYYLGWIEDSQNFNATIGTVNQTINLERLAKPPLTLTPGGTPYYLLAKVPIAIGTQFYSVEHRSLNGYDIDVPIAAGTPGAVIIHKVDPYAIATNANNAGSRLMVVATRQGNVGHACYSGAGGDTNADGGKWYPGQTFIDDAAGISIEVGNYNATTSSFEVVISNGGTPSPTPTNCPAATATPAPTATPTPTPTHTFTPTPTATPTP